MGDKLTNTTRICTCEWDPGDGYMTAPEPITICEYCEGGMAERHRVAYALNVYRNAHPERAEAVRHAMEYAALNPFTGVRDVE